MMTEEEQEQAIYDLTARIGDLEWQLARMAPQMSDMSANYIGWNQVELSGQMQLLKYSPPPEAPVEVIV